MMTQDEIIEMARQAGFVEYELDDGTTNAFDKRYEAFAKLVASKEREACALVCKEIYIVWACESDDDVDYPDPHDCMRAIRARGEPTSRGEA
jgi:hypothetical protein